MQGKLCYQIIQPQDFDGIINVENWVNGIYLLTAVDANDSIQTTKFSVER